MGFGVWGLGFGVWGLGFNNVLEVLGCRGFRCFGLPVTCFSLLLPRVLGGHSLPNSSALASTAFSGTGLCCLRGTRETVTTRTNRLKT